MGVLDRMEQLEQTQEQSKFEEIALLKTHPPQQFVDYMNSTNLSILFPQQLAWKCLRTLSTGDDCEIEDYGGMQMHVCQQINRRWNLPVTQP